MARSSPGSAGQILKNLEYEMDEGCQSGTSQRLRTAVIMTDYQMARAARDLAAQDQGHPLLTRYPDLEEMLPWVKKAA